MFRWSNGRPIASVLFPPTLTWSCAAGTSRKVSFCGRARKIPPGWPFPFFQRGRPGPSLLDQGRLGMAPPQCRLRKTPRVETAAPSGQRLSNRLLPHSRLLTYQTVSKNLVVWEVETGRTLHNFPPPPTRGKVHRSIPILRPYEVAFTPDGKGLICRNGALERWDLATGKAVFPDTDSWGHTEAVTRLLFSPDSKLLASSSRDGTAPLGSRPGPPPS